jgi:hypothetical protein
MAYKSKQASDSNLRLSEQLSVLVSAFEGENTTPPLYEFSVSGLLAGMKLAEDLRYDDRVVLLRKGQVLTASQVDKLQNVFKRKTPSTIGHVRTPTR